MGRSALSLTDSRRLCCFSCLLLFCSLLVPAAPAGAAWLPDGTPLCVLAGDQSGAHTVSDGGQGAIVVWVDGRDGAGADVYAQRLNASGKAQFLIRFWRDRDPTPATEQNEYLEQVQQRYRYANEHFGWGTEEGWANERGRVLIQYGMPDEISRHHSEAETVPYEIWIYSQERRHDFVFADLQSNGHFVLLHSSKEGEVHNTDWRRLIKRL